MLKAIPMRITEAMVVARVISIDKNGNHDDVVLSHEKLLENRLHSRWKSYRWLAQVMLGRGWIGSRMGR